MLLHTAHFTFERVHEGNLETLRRFRNAKSLKQFMVHSSQVSEAGQLEWFTSVNNIHHHYFLVKKENAYIGYCLLKHINFDTKTAEPGTFLVDEKTYESSLAALFLLSFLDICHYFFGIKNFYGNVLASNERALANYRHFNPLQQAGNQPNELLLSSPPDFNYERETRRIRKALETLYNYKPAYKLELENNEPDWLLKLLEELKHT